MRKQLDFLVQYEEEFQGWQRRSSGKFTICYLVFLRKRRRWAFLNTLQALDPPTFKTFGLTFLRKRLWASLICSKTARYRLFLAVVRCCVTTTLAAETFSLLCVYLNYKFGLGLPSFYLFFSFFELPILKRHFTPPRDSQKPKTPWHFLWETTYHKKSSYPLHLISHHKIIA